MKKIPIQSFLIILLWISLFRIQLIPSIVHNFIKVLTIFFITIYIIKNFGIYRDKKRLNQSIILFSSLMFISCIYGLIMSYITFNSMINGIIHILFFVIIDIFVVISYHKNKKITIDTFFYISFLYLIGSLIYILIYGGSNSPDLILYFAGNKFATAYYIILFDVLYAYKFAVPTYKKVSFLIIILFTSFLCYYLCCITAFITSFFLLLIYVKNKKVVNFFRNKNVILLFVLISGIVIFTWLRIMNNEYIIRLFYNILHRNPNLTGRVNIYNSLLRIAYDSPLIGYGYGNNVIMYSLNINYTNAQNGLFQIIIQYGFLGCLFFFKYLRTRLKYVEKESISNWPLYIFIYIMIISSIVEITYSYSFYILIILIYCINNESLNKEVKNEK